MWLGVCEQCKQKSTCLRKSNIFSGNKTLLQLPRKKSAGTSFYKIRSRHNIAKNFDLEGRTKYTEVYTQLCTKALNIQVL